MVFVFVLYPHDIFSLQKTSVGYIRSGLRVSWGSPCHPAAPCLVMGLGGNKSAVVGSQALPSSSVSHSLGLERSFIAHFDFFFSFKQHISKLSKKSKLLQVGMD